MPTIVGVIIVIVLIALAGGAISQCEKQTTLGIWIGNIVFWSIVAFFTITIPTCTYFEMTDGGRPYNKSIGGIVNMSGTNDNKCMQNISNDSLSVRIVWYGSRGGEKTADLFALDPSEKRCEISGHAVYLSNISTGVVISWSEL